MELSHAQYTEELSRITDPTARKLFINSNYPIVGSAQFVLCDPETAKFVTETGSEILKETIVNLDTSDYDIEMCTILKGQYMEARDRFIEFASKLGAKRSTFKIGDIVIDKSDNHTYLITELRGYAVGTTGSDRMFGVTLIGELVRKENIQRGVASTKELVERVLVAFNPDDQK